MRKVSISEKAQIVCGAAVLRYAPISDEVELLTIFKKKTGRFEFPGGKIEPKETVWDATIRETREEIGCMVRSIDRAMTYRFVTETGLKEIYMFKTEIFRGEPVMSEPEKFDGTLWRPVKSYLDGKLPLAPYVPHFAMHTCPDAYKNMLMLKQKSKLGLLGKI